MPEAAEVRIIVDQVKKLCSGSSITKIEILSGRYAKHKDPSGFCEIVKSLPITICNVDCKGKFIYFRLSKDWSIFSTLGMTGSWQTVSTKHSRICMTTSSGKLYFNDVRNFGTIKFVNSLKELNDKKESLGWDPLASAFIFDEQIERIRNESKNKTVAEILMNQHVFSGVGNYVKAESLYRSGISPWRKNSEMKDEEWCVLCEETRRVVIESYVAGGATIQDFIDAHGNKGAYQKNLKVYGKEKDALGNIVKKEETLDKRTTHWVPSIQK